jgi:ABC-2 type transport system permease protein
MKKYLLIFQQTFSQYATYRLQIIFQIVQSFIPPLFMVIALSMTQATGNIFVNQLLPYYILIALIYPLTISTVDEEIENLSVSGDINNFLLKPFSLFKWLYTKNLSEKAVILITLLPIFLLVGLKYGFNLTSLILVIFSLVLSFTLSFTFSFLVGLFCFWIDEFWAIHNLKYVTIQLLGGVILPYTFFPSQTSYILRLSPFPYLAFFPVKVIQNNGSFSDFLTVMAWIIIFLILAALMQKKAIQKYSFTAG